MAKSLVRSIFDILGLHQRVIKEARRELQKKSKDTPKKKLTRQEKREQQKRSRKRNNRS